MKSQTTKSIRKIPLTRGKYAIVDSSDYNILSKYKWGLMNGNNTNYAYTWDTKNKKLITMHSFLLKTPKGFVSDHINSNGLDNRRCNLRIATTNQNQQNSRISIRNKTGYKGVKWNKNGYQASIVFNKEQIYLGRFRTAKEAHEAYKRAGLELFKEYFRER